MEISRTTVGIVAAACLVTGAAGAYVATRSANSSADSAISAAVEQSEAVVTEAPTTPAIEQAPVQNSRTTNRTPARQVARPAAPPAAVATAPSGQTTSIETQAAHQGNPTPGETRGVVFAAPEPVEPAQVFAEEPPAPLFEDLVVAADSVLGLQMETSLTSETARVEDTVMAHVTRDVRVGDRVAIPAGAKARGEVTMVERGGRLREKARLAIRFTSVVLADGTRVPIETDTIFREGDGPGGESAAKIGGGAIGGAILGGIFGGAKGAVIGGTAGAGAGTAAVLAGSRNPATLASGTPVTVRLVRPATVTVDAP